jgi:predicted DNA-binding WGR domain protein
MLERRLIFMDAKSSKFWTIRQEGNEHTVTYGRIGTLGQTSSKNFESEALAQKDVDKLIKEKLGKGYVDEAAPAGDGMLPTVAFGQISERDDISRNAGTFVGLRVIDYAIDRPARSDVAYRFRSDWDEDVLAPSFEHFVATPAALDCTALVIGAWFGDESNKNSSEIIQLLISHRERLPKLVAIYLGDVTSEENEMSWIYQSDLAPLLAAFPKLQLLRTRGGTELALTPLRHSSLRALALETGGMDAGVISQVLACDFPQLEYLELWLGTEDYGGSVSIEQLQPLFSGALFPKLTYLGLRNSDLADAICRAVVNSPLMERLEVLDLSLGTLSDEGGAALLALTGKALRKINLHHHYMTPEMVRKLRALPFVVDASTPDMDHYDEDDRFVAVGE